MLYVTGPENQRAIVEMSIDGGPAREVLTAALSLWEITRVAYSPDARWITFETADRQLFAMPVDGGQPQQLLRGSSHSWDQTSRRIYYAIQSGTGDTRIEAAEIEESSTGLSVGRTFTIGFNTGVLHEFALAADGRRLLVAAVEESLNLTRVALAAGGAGVVGTRGGTDQRAGARSLPDVLSRWTARCRREQSSRGRRALGRGTRLDATEKGGVTRRREYLGHAGVLGQGR